ncbi:Catechol 2,3-dioxygenase [Candidatus Methanophagaceae archaeon]|nr:Catechol 2,3-dioxygenase [Methanophagales archaeon]
MNRNNPRTPKITKLHHVTIEVSDIEEAFQFYTKILGFEELPTPRKIKDNGIRWISLPGNQAIHLIESDSRAPESAHMAIQVDDVEKWKKYLNDHHIEIHPPKLDIYNAKRFFFKDPSGNRIEFVKWLI